MSISVTKGIYWSLMTGPCLSFFLKYSVLPFTGIAFYKYSKYADDEFINFTNYLAQKLGYSSKLNVVMISNPVNTSNNLNVVQAALLRQRRNGLETFSSRGSIFLLDQDHQQLSTAQLQFLLAMQMESLKQHHTAKQTLSMAVVPLAVHLAVQATRPRLTQNAITALPLAATTCFLNLYSKETVRQYSLSSIISSAMHSLHRVQLQDNPSLSTDTAAERLGNVAKEYLQYKAWSDLTSFTSMNENSRLTPQQVELPPYLRPLLNSVNNTISTLKNSSNTQK
eukprot:gb/GECH01002502.1/.p1 GENE.gb/GECH01002502.1/~~gb/GECH01002502.1/.p1  ORF type:complete len:281 (+),score=55.53 gb/GECH01002502.1/:1-843(+)